MPDGSIIATSGSVFAISSENGDVNPGTTEGFYSSDTRFLSTFKLLVDDQKSSSVGVNRFEPSIVSFYSIPGKTRNLAPSSLSIVRDRSIDKGLHEDIYIKNDSLEDQSFDVEIVFDSDFADVFEVRRGSIHKGGKIRTLKRAGHYFGLEYQRGDYRRGVSISLSAVPIVHENKFVLNLSLAPRIVWKTCINVTPVLGQTSVASRCVGNILGSPFAPFRRKSSGFLRHKIDGKLIGDPKLPELYTDHKGLEQAYYQAIYDLSSLQLEILPKKYVLAAGLPWFMAVFGRDSIISAIQTKILGTSLLMNTIQTLAALQARRVDRFSEAQPGKILHEVRHGELSIFKEVPHSCYYGSVDVTPLFVMLLWEAYQWKGDKEFLKKYITAAESAINWINQYGDLDGDGFVEYQGLVKEGLRNQGWKDSHDSISFATGELAESPIALAEVQGYVFSAKTRMADLYRVLGDVEKAEKLQVEAKRLKQEFNAAFWLPKKQYFALALDGKKEKVDAISSNPGHCLWTHIVDDDKAPMVVRRLMSSEMFTGWGIRTLSSKMAQYNPLSYHNGSVWPHDTSIISAGMKAYGFFKESNELALSLIDAAAAFPEHRLPELFAGYVRREHSRPIPYPAANAPQAWASGALIYCIETLLGLTPSGERLTEQARPEGMALSLTGVEHRGTLMVL
ncbi:MAG: amylo-alpha-1,6-glucosidase [Thaumarchaeota archaeon]|nr:amylo-alpha-1,6-glucosidase [Nitrososphaerota archaeon]